MIITGTNSFAVSFDDNSVYHYELYSTISPPFYEIKRTEQFNTDSVYLMVWIRNTDFYIGVLKNNNLIRAQISTIDQSSERAFGGSPISTGYFDNGDAAYAIVFSIRKIKFINHM